MPESDALPLLNVFEVAADDGGTRHLLAFIEPVRAGSSGIVSKSVVGEINPTDGGGFDPRSLKINGEFLQAISDYMNDVQARAPEIVEQARAQPSNWVYIIDPRNRDDGPVEPPPTDLVGAFAVDDAGQIVPRSFQYNANHALIDQDRGVTGLFSDRRFYDWMHPGP